MLANEVEDVALLLLLLAFVLSDIDQFSARACVLQNFGSDQTVIEHDIGLPEKTHGL